MDNSRISRNTNMYKFIFCGERCTRTDEKKCIEEHNKRSKFAECENFVRVNLFTIISLKFVCNRNLHQSLNEDHLKGFSAFMKSRDQFKRKIEVLKHRRKIFLVIVQLKIKQVSLALTMNQKFLQMNAMSFRQSV
jgi:hypothetical protein